MRSKNKADPADDFCSGATSSSITTRGGFRLKRRMSHEPYPPPRLNRAEHRFRLTRSARATIVAGRQVWGALQAVLATVTGEDLVTRGGCHVRFVGCFTVLEDEKVLWALRGRDDPVKLLVVVGPSAPGSLPLTGGHYN